jgi:hypothetical protein
VIISIFKSNTFRRAIAAIVILLMDLGVAWSA